MSLVWMNGTLADKLDARVSPFDHGFLYGDGVWEPLRVFAGKAFNAAHHLNLLFTAAEALGIEVPLSRGELLGAIDQTLHANHRSEGYVRVIVTRGVGTLGPDPRKLDPQVIVIAEEYQPFPAELAEYGLYVTTYPTPFDAEHPANRVRTLGRPHIALAKQDALRHGCLEALLATRTGELIGTTEGMLFLVQDGAVIVAGGHVPEATGYAVAALAGEGGLVVAECAVRMPELLAADEAFLAGTACGVIAIVRVDGQLIGDGSEGPVTRGLRTRFTSVTRSSGVE
jgi:branched-chain amino acid aminotransferase